MTKFFTQCRPLMCAVLSLLLVGTLFSIRAFCQDKPRVGDPVKLVREASVAAKINLRSGSGSAVFERYVKMPGKTDLELVRKADCKILFDGDKYYIQLDFRVDKTSNDQTQIVVCDGKAIITKEVSPLFRPNGSQGAVFPIRGANIRSYSADVPINPAKFQDAIMDVAEAIKKFDPAIAWNNETGAIEGTFASQNIINRFVAGPKAGYNVEHRSVINCDVSKTEPVTEFVAKWEQSNGVWFIKSLQETFKSQSGLMTRWKLEYSSFSPNVPVAPEQFHLNALRFEKGVRILDQRPGVPVRSYEFGVSRETDSAKLDSLVGQVESLPVRHRLQEPPAKKSRRWQWALISFGAVACLSGVLLVGRRYWIRHASTKSRM